ncbi:MAG: aspartate 1-decarboxylase [Lentisphaerae bacterium]|nr:aspartate 1-decarboxylase [Lentisphaerota bacterium]
MFSIMLKSKLHLARVTHVKPDYEGSLTIDRNLMDAVKLLPYEKVLVANLANANRFETYVIPGKPGDGVICLNGPAARLGSVGDKLVILAFSAVPTDEARRHRPLILTLNERNQPTGPLKEI